jgi:AcrR family transcriptional regulator
MEKKPKTTKAEHTRTLILNTALDLFRERGYENTTMRAIAEKADVSLGNAYYYYESKEHLIQVFYDELNREQIEACKEVLDEEKKFKKRLLEVMRTKFRVIEPYHRFAAILFKTAADPLSFSKESEAVRDESIAFFEELVAGSNLKLPKDLEKELPYLLWLFHMGLILFWIHDNSDEKARSHMLTEKSVEIIDRCVNLASYALMRPLRKSVLSLVADLRR